MTHVKSMCVVFHAQKSLNEEQNYIVYRAVISTGVRL